MKKVFKNLNFIRPIILLLIGTFVYCSDSLIDVPLIPYRLYADLYNYKLIHFTWFMGSYVIISIYSMAFLWYWNKLKQFAFKFFIINTFIYFSSLPFMVPLLAVRLPEFLIYILYFGKYPILGIISYFLIKRLFLNDMDRHLFFKYYFICLMSSYLVLEILIRTKISL